MRSARAEPCLPRRGPGAVGGTVLLVLLLVALPAVPAAAAPSVVWTRGIDGVGEDDDVRGVALDAAGNVYVAGSLDTEQGTSGPFAMLRRYSPSGTLRWQRLYEGPEALAYGRGVAVDGHGRAYLVGETTAPPGAPAFILLKYSPSGTRLWARYVEGVAGRGVAVGAGRVVAVGARSTANRGYDVWVRAYTPAGTRLWTRSYDGPAGDDDLGLAVAVGADGSVYVVGSVATSTSPWNEDMFIRRYGPDGTVAWTRLLRDAANDFDDAQAAAVSGRALYVGGIVDGSEGGPTFGDAWLRRLSTATGATVWTRRWGGGAGGNDDVAGLAVDGRGRVYAVGTQVETGIEGNANIFLRSYTAAGILRWKRAYDGGADDYGTAVAVGGADLVAGGYRWAGATGLDGWVRRYTGIG